MGKRLRLALFISGGGTTAEAVINVCNKGKLAIDPVLVIASKENIGGIEKVKKAGVNKSDIVVVNPARYKNAAEFADILLHECDKRNVELIGQYGWLPLTPRRLIQKYNGRIINQHPGPLDAPRPDFGGKGMYGKRVHCAVLYFRRVTEHDFWTEAVTHVVTDEFDKGQVVKRKTIPILSNDTVEDLQMRVLPIEHQVQIEALRDFAASKVKFQKRQDPLIKVREYAILEEAKKIASLLYPNG